MWEHYGSAGCVRYRGPPLLASGVHVDVRSRFRCRIRSVPEAVMIVDANCSHASRTTQQGSRMLGSGARTRRGWAVPSRFPRRGKTAYRSTCSWRRTAMSGRAECSWPGYNGSVAARWAVSHCYQRGRRVFATMKAVTLRTRCW